MFEFFRGAFISGIILSVFVLLILGGDLNKASPLLAWTIFSGIATLIYKQ